MLKTHPNRRLSLTLPLRLTPFQYAQLERLAEQQERSRSAVIRTLIDQAAKRLPKERETQA